MLRPPSSGQTSDAQIDTAVSINIGEKARPKSRYQLAFLQSAKTYSLHDI